VLPLLPLLTILQAPLAPQMNADLICQFQAGVDAYVALHRRLEAPLPPHVITDDPARLFVPRVALAAAIRAERGAAREGEIFTPEVAFYFRRVLNATIREHRIDLLAIFEEDHLLSYAIDVRVNADYPAGAPVSFMAPQILAALPPLPPELEYRFANVDLILWDVHAGLIVDVIRNAAT
jgi:hypothetical protein